MGVAGRLLVTTNGFRASSTVMASLGRFQLALCVLAACGREEVPLVEEEPEPEVADVVPTRERPTGPFAALESGVLSRDLIGTCSEPVRSDLGARATGCGAGQGDCVAPPLGIAGFHEDGRVALVSAPWVDACEPKTTYRLSEVSLPWLHGDDVTTFDPDAQGAGGPMWRWLAARFRRGFVGTDDLAARTCQYEAWASPARSLAFLGHPLDKWMLTIGRGRRTLPIRLVGPSNQRTFDFDAFVLKPGRTCELDDQKKDVCLREMSADIVQVALAPNRRSLLVTLLIGTPERCGTRYVVHEVLRLPDAVRKLMPKGREAPVLPDLAPVPDRSRE